MYLEPIPDNAKTTTKVRIQYDCCHKQHTLKWKDANANYTKNKGRHICRPCWLKSDDNPAKKDESKEKVKKTNLERYGCVVAMNNPENTAKRVEKMFGTESSKQEIVNKRKKTSQERYGADHIMKTEEGINRVKSSMQAKYGVDFPLQNKEVMAKNRRTNMERYGVENVAASPEVRAKMAQTTLERHGVEHYNQLPEMKEYLRENCTKWLAESYATGGPAKGITRPEEWNQKQRETVLKLIDEGKWNSGPISSLKGKYLSQKCQKSPVGFRSSYELKVHWHLDHDEKVEWYDYEPFQVSYYDTEGKKRHYVIDFIVKYKDRKKPLAIEVKNNYTRNSDLTKAKYRAFLNECQEVLDCEFWTNEKISSLNLKIEFILESQLVIISD